MLKSPVKESEELDVSDLKAPSPPALPSEELPKGRRRGNDKENTDPEAQKKIEQQAQELVELQRKLRSLEAKLGDLPAPAVVPADLPVPAVSSDVVDSIAQSVWKLLQEKNLPMLRGDYFSTPHHPHHPPHPTTTGADDHRGHSASASSSSSHGNGGGPTNNGSTGRHGGGGLPPPGGGQGGVTINYNYYNTSY
jgi:hypothetical protein